MRTDDLINALAADRPVARPRLRLMAPLLVGVAVMLLGYALLLEARPDFATAARSGDFLLKLVAAAALAVAAAGTMLRLAAPGRLVGMWKYGLLLPAVFIAAGIAATMAGTPSSVWWTRMIGTNSLVCLSVIPALAAAPLAGALACLRTLAPTRPAMAGGVAGLLAGGLAAVLYGTTCIDDSPLFVAVWYSLAIGLVAAAGAALGHRLLRW